MSPSFCSGLFTLLFLVATQGSRVTPMEKVVTLLKDLSSKVSAEGAKEAAQYDKFACFCKEQADEKQYSIEKSDAKIATLKAEIKDLDASIAQLNSEISSLSKKISSLEADIKARTDKRAKEHDKYLVKAKDMNEAIGACGAAIDALKNSKTAMKDAKLDLAQVKKSIGALMLDKVSHMDMNALAPGAVLLLSQLNGKAAPKFEYQSNDIIATLESLSDTFKSMKKDLDVEEFDTNSAFDSTKLGLSNEKTFAEKEKDEKETNVEDKTEQLETAKNDRDVETADRTSDSSFMKELTNECEKKAELFDQRSKLRSSELSTLSDAIEELQKGAAPNYSANKKLAGVQVKAVVKKLVGVQVKAVVKRAVVPAPSFIQISNVARHELSGKEVVLQKILSSLNGAAGRMGSATLANVAMRIKMAEDHFVKVRALIKDLMAKLKADAKSEASQKSICDKSMKKAITDRDDANAKIEVASAKITTLTAKKNQLKDDISTLNSDIADLKKALLEATELRSDDKADNTKTIAMSKEAIASVKLALSLLQDFYKKALVQTGKYTPPKADREGNTVGDLAPAAFDSKYHGAQAESKGIVGILEVILSDFERTDTKTKSDEKESQAVFEKLESDINVDVKTKEGSIKKKDAELTDTKSDIIDQQQALKDAKNILEGSQKSLEDLEAMCVKGEETWEERKKKREEEIEALKSAMQILDDWQA